ncbi:MAG: murein biosynthesis integral membrane protein MurJ [Candidatus Hydrothermae bacterium]|nr:murein biosynthesis integral membrane protein MurJ [Candidatus Hydrothermae bacterium]
MRYRSVGSFAIATLFSRILGFVREAVIAYLLGAGKFSDAFYVAFRIPNLLRDLLAENAVQNSFIPSYVEAKEKGEKPENFLGTVLILLLAVSLFFLLIGLLFTPLLVSAFAYGFRGDPAKFSLTVHLTRITFPYLLLVSLGAFAGGILLSNRKFFIPAFSPVLFNLGIIAVSLGAFFLLKGDKTFYARALALGVIAGGSLQLIFQLLFIPPLRINPRLDLKHPQIRKFFKLLVPVVLSTAFSRLTLFVNTLIASFLRNGAISYLNYAFRVMHLPIGLFSVGVATVALPDIAERAAREESTGPVISKALKLTLYLTVPSTLFLILDAEKIIHILFERGSFDHMDTWLASQALVFYALSVMPTGVSKVLLGHYFSHGQTRAPNIILALSAAVNISVALLLSPFLGFPALALATALSSTFQGLVLFFLLKDLVRWEKGGLSFLAKLAVANTAMACLILLKTPWNWNLDLLFDLFAGGLLYVGLSAILGFEEVNFIFRKRARGDSNPQP